jgi:hypothetical protein
MLSQALTSTVATLLVLRSYMGIDELELEIPGYDSGLEKNTIEISCVRDRLLIDLFMDIGNHAKEDQVILRGSGLNHLFHSDTLASLAECRVAITTGAAKIPTGKQNLNLTVVVDKSGSISVVGDGHDGDQVNHLIDQAQHVLGQLETAGPTTTLKDISIVSKQDIIQLRKWNGTGLELKNQCLHDAVLDVASMYPTKTAIATREQCFTYRDLDLGSAILARCLMDRGIANGATVPMCFEKSALVPVIMMAVVRAGAAFIPLDPSNPDERLRTILHESEAKFVITSTTQSERIAAFGVDVEVVDENTLTSHADVDDARPLATVTPDDLAYIIYTSGK